MKKSDRVKIYEEIIPQIKFLISSESDMVAVMANISAILKYQLDFLWCGFYIVKGDILVLGPFQGKSACCRIPFGKGVCGTAWKNRETTIVDDVDKCTNYIKCDVIAASEIVVPIIKGGCVVAVLDIDSNELSDFSQEDKYYLEHIVNIISEYIL